MTTKKKIFKIVRDEAGQYRLLSPEQATVSENKSRRRLSDEALFDLGADEVCHDYDLIRAEEDERF